MERIINTIEPKTEEDYFAVIMHLKFINQKLVQEPRELPERVSQTYNWHRSPIVDNITPVIFKKMVSKQPRYNHNTVKMKKWLDKKLEKKNRELKNNVYLNP